jgi:cytochrome c oxidase assembly protein subunit 15
MSTNSANGKTFITRRHRDLLLATSVLTYFLVTLGGIVCMTDASRGCPDWPGCYGQIVPPMRIDSILEYAHRVLAALTSLLIISSAITGWRKVRGIRWVSRPPVLAIALLLAVIVFGAMVVLRGLAPGLAALDLGSALGVLALMLVTTVVAFSRHQDPTLPDQLVYRTLFARLTLWTLVAVFVVLVGGVLVAADNSPVRCLSWPLYGQPLPLDEARGWLQLARQVLGAGASILVIAVVVGARRRPGAIRRTATVVGLLFAIELAVGVLVLVSGPAVWLQVIRVATTAALWGLLIVLAVLAGLPSPAPTDGDPASRQDGGGQTGH